MSLPSPTFDRASVDAAIPATQFAGHVTYLETTPSTNDLALKAALAGARSGVWIADQQIAGRGRGRNTWHSPAGSGIYMTALVAPPIPMQNALALSLRVAVAVQSAIVATTPFTRPDQIDIRWPNDLMLNGKKVGGILIDTASNPARPDQPATLRYAVVGIGLNVNQTRFPPELDAIATSLRRELARPGTPYLGVPGELARWGESLDSEMWVDSLLPREPLIAAILIALDAELRALTTSNPQPATCDCPDPTACSTWIQGKRVRVEPRDASPGYTGTTAGLNPSGFLLVNGDDGQLHTVLSGGLREP
jgi:BirA family biotin operon repressor/biotin-[acetyl-CoA-carboxylase] ligase